MVPSSKCINSVLLGMTVSITHGKDWSLPKKMFLNSRRYIILLLKLEKSHKCRLLKICTMKYPGERYLWDVNKSQYEKEKKISKF